MGDFMTTELTTTDVERTIGADVDGQITVNASGGGATTEEATLTALGEFLERYSMYWPLEGTVVGSYVEVEADGHVVVDCEYLEVWREADLRDANLETFDAETEIEWVPGTHLRSGETVLVPAKFVTFASTLDGTDYFPSSTNGTACGSSLAEATRNALYERIERDAIMRTWYEQRSPPRIDISNRPELNSLRDLISSSHARIELLNLPTPTDCTVVAAAWVDNRHVTPKFLLYGGAHLTTGEAIRDALEETAEGIIQTKYRLIRGEDVPPETVDIDRVYNLSDNVDYYMRPEQFNAVSHLLDGDVGALPPGDNPVSEDAAAELAAAVDAVPESDLTPVAVDITPPDVRELGMYVVSVVVPELVDMALPGVPPVHHPRLRVETTAGHPFP